MGTLKYVLGGVGALILVYLLVSHTTTTGILSSLGSNSVSAIKALQGR